MLDYTSFPIFPICFILFIMPQLDILQQDLKGIKFS